jgi:hypothetical protein
MGQATREVEQLAGDVTGGPPGQVETSGSMGGHGQACRGAEFDRG